METNVAQPKVSIVMPAYNSGPLIVESIQSVINQTYNNWELIVIDDGSSDNTFDLVNSLSMQDARIKLFRQKNQGIGATRNNGYKYASGEWLAYLDHDDLWHPKKLEVQMTAAFSDLEYDVIFSGGWFFYNNDISNLTEYRTISGTFKHDEMYLKQLEENYVATLSIMVKRSLLEEIGPWDERKLIQGCDDYDYLFRMAKANATFHGVKDQLFYYRKHDSNYSNDYVKMFVAEANVLVDNFDKGILNSHRKIKKFEKKIHSLILSLIRLGEVSRTLDVLAHLNKLLPSVYGQLSHKALKAFQTKALLIVKCLLKLERTIN